MAEKAIVTAYGFTARGTVTDCPTVYTFSGMITDSKGEEQSYLVAVGCDVDELMQNIEDTLLGYFEVELILAGKLVRLR